MDSYYSVVTKLEARIDNAVSEKSKQDWVRRYLQIVLPRDQKQKYKDLEVK